MRCSWATYCRQGSVRTPRVSRRSAPDLSENVPATTINKVCGSGLKTVALAAQAIRAGDAECLVAGGMENMSRAPYLMQNGRYGYRLGHGQLVDEMIRDGLWCALDDCHMGSTAENIARELRGDSRGPGLVCRRVATEGRGCHQERPLQGRDRPCGRAAQKGDGACRHRRASPSRNDRWRRLPHCEPLSPRTGTVTAGNASGINDGAAAVVVMSASRAKAENRIALARIRGYSSAGVAPRIMGMGPVPAVRSALQKAGVELRDIDLFELNEAFAAQAVAVGRELAVPEDRLNVNGGAIAIGHPIGASGTRLLVTLLFEMAKRDVNLGVAALCIGGGQGIAMVLERS